jgi:hypothetical protein
LRTAGKPIGGKRLALAPENRICGVDQAVDRDLLGVVVAAEKLYFASPVHLAAGAGNPAGSSGAKSNAADVMKLSSACSSR